MARHAPLVNACVNGHAVTAELQRLGVDINTQDNAAHGYADDARVLLAAPGGVVNVADVC